MLFLRIKAPFAAFRPFVAGSYRQTVPFVTPTAAYGLLLNLAGIESRRVEPDAVATDTAYDLPACEIAIGMVREPSVARMLHQLHNYPVGNTGKEHAAATRGAKYNIQPIVRELLVGVDAVIGLRSDEGLGERVRDGLARGLSSPQRDGSPRYGVPFFGDNSFLVDIVAELPETGAEEARWFCPLDRLPPSDGVRPGTCRMPLWIDRNDMTRTRTALFAPSAGSRLPPEEAWVSLVPQTRPAEEEPSSRSAGRSRRSKAEAITEKARESTSVREEPSPHKRAPEKKEPPVHEAVSDFMALDDEGQAQAAYLALLGLGPVADEDAPKTVALRLKESGMASFERLRTGGPLHTAIEAALSRAKRNGWLDKPTRGFVRAVRPDAKGYDKSHWDLCVASADLSECSNDEERLRSAAEWARDNLGLRFERLRTGGTLWNGLLAALRRSKRNT